jgi:hypothetical protein
MTEKLQLIDLTRMRRHVAEYRRAWSAGSAESEFAKTIAALLCAEDLDVLLAYVDDQSAPPAAEGTVP